MHIIVYFTLLFDPAATEGSQQIAAQLKAVVSLFVQLVHPRKQSSEWKSLSENLITGIPVPLQSRETYKLLGTIPNLGLVSLIVTATWRTNPSEKFCQQQLQWIEKIQSENYVHHLEVRLYLCVISNLLSHGSHSN